LKGQPVDGIMVKEVRITMPNGFRLAADLYLPEAKTFGEKLHVLMEYLPYRRFLKVPRRTSTTPTHGGYLKMAKCSAPAPGKKQSQGIFNDYT
jgi:predicted acyl esterase